MLCILALGISCYMTKCLAFLLHHKILVHKKGMTQSAKYIQENQNIHWNSVTTSGYGPTDATAELTWPWPSTTPWGQNLSEVVLNFYASLIVQVIFLRSA